MNRSAGFPLPESVIGPLSGRLDRSERCKCCGHLEPARRVDAETILPRDEHERIIKLGDSLILTALMNSGLPRAHY